MLTHILSKKPKPFTYVVDGCTNLFAFPKWCSMTILAWANSNSFFRTSSTVLVAGVDLPPYTERSRSCGYDLAKGTVIILLPSPHSEPACIHCLPVNSPQGVSARTTVYRLRRSRHSKFEVGNHARLCYIASLFCTNVCFTSEYVRR